MLSESQIRSVCLFFFFSLLDEKAAAEAAVAVLNEINSHLKKVREPDSVATSMTIHYLWRRWHSLSDKRNFGQPLVFSEQEWIMPKGIDMGPWLEFRRQANEEEFLAVLWSKVLGYSDRDIATGWGISEGTLRHRVGHGLRTLGSSQNMQGAP